MSDAKPISISEAARRHRDGTACIIDVRSPGEYEDMHVSGSLLAPLDELNPNDLGDRIEGGKGVLLLCRSGKRASAACGRLGTVFPDAQVIEGGIEAWAAAGEPVEKGRGVISLERQVRIAAGALVLLGSILAWKLSLGFLALPAFVGAGLMFAGITDTCGMGMMLAKAPWNKRVGAKAQAALAGA